MLVLPMADIFAIPLVENGAEITQSKTCVSDCVLASIS